MAYCGSSSTATRWSPNWRGGIGAPLPPRLFGDHLVALLDDPQYSDGVAFGLKGDTGITVLEGEAA